MRKMLLIIPALAIFVFAKANPLVPPSVVLSEIAFDANNNWVLELQTFDGGPYMMIDSIQIETSTGLSLLKNIHYTTPYIIIVRNDSLTSPLNINPLGDSVQVTYFFYAYPIVTSSVVFGNCDGSRIRGTKTGESIAGVPPYFNYSRLYSLDKSPTIGIENDTTGMCCTMKGNIYDMNNELLNIPGGKFEFYYCPAGFYSKADGSYTARMYSFKNTITTLFYYTSENKGQWLNIKPIHVEGNPDSIIEMDIYLKSPLSDVELIEYGSSSVLKIYPNPAVTSSFNYEVSIPVKSAESFLELMSANGQQVGLFNLFENSGKINLPANLPAGNYTVRLFVKKKHYATEKLIISK